MSNHNPMQQFEINSIFNIRLMNIDISFTNASLYMLLSISIIMIFFHFSLKNVQILPGKVQNIAEILYEFVTDIIKDNIGNKGLEYMPLIFSSFVFILVINLLGMTPYGFTVTSHIAVTLFMATTIFLICTVIGFYKHGVHFLSLFLPEGTPLWLAPFMIIIELFTYLARPFTLSIRLAGNMVAGHVLMKVLASFVVGMGIYFGWIPLPLMIVLSGFEIFVAILQAYIFTILTCVYLNDAINLH